MKYCEKCGKPLETKKDNYNGLCLNCYQEYLLEKVEHIGENDDSSNETKPLSLWGEIKELSKEIWEKIKKR